MITQSNFHAGEAPDSIKKEMSPQHIHAPSFEEDDFDIPQVAIPASAMSDDGSTNGPNPQSHPNFHNQIHPNQTIMTHYQQVQQHQDYNTGNYYAHQHPHQHPDHLQHHQHLQHQQHMQWAPEYGQYQQYHQQYQQQGYQQVQGYNQYGMYQQHSEGMYNPNTNNMPPGRSPSGSHSTPSPHTQSEGSDDHIHHMNELKRPLPDTFRTETMVVKEELAPSRPKKPKVSRRKKKRDPNEPNKPVSAYALFFRDSQAAIKGRNPNSTFGDVSKMVASLWDSLDPDSKAMYKKRTEMAKKDYLRQLAAYRANLVSTGGGDSVYGGFPGYGFPGMPGMEANEMVQHVPPHPPGPHMPPGYCAENQEFLQQATGHPELPAGSQPGITSLPGQTPETGTRGTPRGPGVYGTPHEPPCSREGPGGPPYSPPYGSGPPHGTGSERGHVGITGSDRIHVAMTGNDPNLTGSDRNLVTHDRNHNSTMYPGRTRGECGRPGCSNMITPGEAVDGNFCSSECVVGQCREVYTSWAGQGTPPQVK